MFLYVFMGLPVLAQVSAAQFPLVLAGAESYTQSEVQHVTLVVVVGIAAFEVGYFARQFRRRPGPRGEVDESTKPYQLRKRAWRLSEGAALSLGVIALLFTGILLYRTGVSPFFDSRQAATNATFGQSANAIAYLAENKAVNGLVTYAAQGPLLVSLFAILYMRHHRIWRKGSHLQEVSAQALIVLLVLGNIIVNNPISNARFWVGTIAIAFASIYVPLTKAAGIRWAAIMSIAVLLFGFTSLQAFRRSGGAQQYSAGFRADLISSGTYSEFVMEIMGRRWLSDHDHTRGRQLLGAVAIFVPRSVWPSKPVDTGNLVLPYANPAASLWTEGDVEGGPLGVIVFFVALGAISGTGDRRLRRSAPGSPAHVLVPIMGGFMIFVLRGSIAAAVGPAYVLTACLLFVLRRSKSVTQPAVDTPSRRKLTSS